MRMTTISDEQELLDFVSLASLHFMENPQHHSFTDGEIEPGCLFALWWGLGDDCVLVYRLSEEFEPRIYQQCIRTREVL